MAKKKQNIVNGGGTKSNNGASNQIESNGSNQDDSPLRIFGQAKEEINDIYSKLDECLKKASSFYSKENLVSETAIVDKLGKMSDGIATIRGVLGRNRMKVVFFGQTSNGKSSVINAILREPVVPTSSARTTGCFIQIQGTHENSDYIEVPRRDGQGHEKKNIQDLEVIADALSPGHLECSTLIELYWPITRCPLLKHDVVLVDSPGVDSDENLDQWIDKHCRDADVFVQVSDVDRELSLSEKRFFHKVSEKLSKPNIFVLYNKWDNVNDAKGRVKPYQTERVVNFLTKELNVSSPEEARQRTFFVSAKDTLSVRFSKKNDSNDLGDEEFKNFERRLEESLSKSAVKTKFMQHHETGRYTVKELISLLDNTKQLIEQTRLRKSYELENGKFLYDKIQESFYSHEKTIRQEINERTKHVIVEAENKFQLEIRRLHKVVNEFEMKFSTNKEEIGYYKKQLCEHVQANLSGKFKKAIDQLVEKHISPFKDIMLKMSSLLSEQRRQRIEQAVAITLPSPHLFEIYIDHQEFVEDLEFRFSLTRLLRLTPISSPDSLSIVEKFILNPPQSPATVGSLAVGGILVRTVGLKVLVITTAVFGALYAYEYLTWTNSAKERAFKSQFVKYASRELQKDIRRKNPQIEKTIENQLTSAIDIVQEEVDNESKQIADTVNKVKESLGELVNCDNFTRCLLDESNFLMTELLAFASSFFAPV